MSKYALRRKKWHFLAVFFIYLILLSKKMILPLFLKISSLWQIKKIYIYFFMQKVLPPIAIFWHCVSKRAGVGETLFFPSF